MSKKTKKAKKTYLFDDPKNIKKLLYGFYGLCVLLVLADFIIHRHVLMDWERIPAFYALYGFAAYVLLVLISVGLRMIVMRRENYYDD